MADNYFSRSTNSNNGDICGAVLGNIAIANENLNQAFIKMLDSNLTVPKSCSVDSFFNKNNSSLFGDLTLGDKNKSCLGQVSDFYVSSLIKTLILDKYGSLSKGSTELALKTLLKDNPYLAQYLTEAKLKTILEEMGEDSSIAEKTFNRTPKNDFEKEWQAKGFPPSYWDYLTNLKKLHPNYEIDAFQTGLDFGQAAIEQQDAGKCDACEIFGPLGLIDNWNGEGGWQHATLEFASHLIDPRNNLHDEAALMFMDLDYTGEYEITEDNIRSVLSGTKFVDTSGSILRHSVANNINPLYVAALTRNEGTVIWGKEGVYNPWNMGAYDGNAYVGGVAAAKQYGWYSPDAAFKGGSQMVSEKYIHASQNTLYYIKYDVADDHPYTHQYQSSHFGPVSQAHDIYKELKGMGVLEQDSKVPIRLVIPVYENMPETTFSEKADKAIYNSLYHCEGDSTTTLINKGQYVEPPVYVNSDDANGTKENSISGHSYVYTTTPGMGSDNTYQTPSPTASPTSTNTPSPSATPSPSSTATSEPSATSVDKNSHYIYTSSPEIKDEIEKYQASEQAKQVEQTKQVEQAKQVELEKTAEQEKQVEQAKQPIKNNNSESNTSSSNEGTSNDNGPTPINSTPTIEPIETGIKWPDNEFTKDIPAPDFGITGVTTSTNDNNFIFTLFGCENDDINNYRELLRKLFKQLNDNTFLRENDNMTIMLNEKINGDLELIFNK